MGQCLCDSRAGLTHCGSRTRQRASQKNKIGFSNYFAAEAVSRTLSLWVSGLRRDEFPADHPVCRIQGQFGTFGLIMNIVWSVERHPWAAHAANTPGTLVKRWGTRAAHLAWHQALGVVLREH